MPNTFKYNTSSIESQSLRKGNFYIGTGDVGKGTSDSTGFYNGFPLGTFSYVIVLHRGGNVPTYYRCQDDAELISRTNQIDTSSVRTTKEECFSYFANQVDKLVVNKDTDPFITDSLVFGLDGSYLPSYPSTFSISYDISNLSTQPNSIVKNFSLQLTSWSTKRSDISLVTNIQPPFPEAQVWSSTINTVSYANTLHRVWTLGSSNGIIGSLGSGFYRYYLWARGASHNSAAASITIDISDAGGIARATSIVATSSVWRVLSTWDNVSTTYNADKFFDYELAGTNGDTIYISSIVIAAYDVANANDLTKLHSFPGPIDYGKTASVQKQGTLLNGVSFSPTEGSFNLDGSNDYIEVGSETSLNFGTGDFTVLCWVGGLTAYPGSAKSIIWKGSRFDGNIAGWSMTWAGSPQDLYFIISSDSQRLEARTVPNSGLNGWVGYKMIGMQRSGSSWRQINGTTVTQLGTFAGNVDSANSVLIGRNGHYTTHLSNLVNKVLIYNRALSQSEILQNYFRGSIVTSGLVLSFDPGNLVSYPTTGTSSFDMSTFSNHGVLQNSPTFNNRYGGYLIFDGQNDYADFPFSGRSSTANTVEMFVRWRSASGGMFMGFTTYDIWTTGASLGFNTGVGDLWGISSTRVTQLNLIGISNSNWHHYVFVFTSQVQNNKIYIDGNLETLSQIAGVTNLTTTRSFSSTLRISGWPNNVNYVLAGDYSIIRIYNRELSTSEISQNFNAHRSRFDI